MKRYEHTWFEGDMTSANDNNKKWGMDNNAIRSCWLLLETNGKDWAVGGGGGQGAAAAEVVVVMVAMTVTILRISNFS